MNRMPEFSVAPHANPGDEFTLVPRFSDFPPDPPTHDKVTSGKVTGDATVKLADKVKDGDYWIMVNGASVGVTVGDRAGMVDRAAEKRREDAQRDADKLAERNRQEKVRMSEKADEQPEPTQENRPPNPEDQPNELPIEDNTGSTKRPTGGDAALTGPTRTNVKHQAGKPAAKKKRG